MHKRRGKESAGKRSRDDTESPSLVGPSKKNRLATDMEHPFCKGSKRIKDVKWGLGKDEERRKHIDILIRDATRNKREFPTYSIILDSLHWAREEVPNYAGTWIGIQPRITVSRHDGIKVEDRSEIPKNDKKSTQIPDLSLHCIRDQRYQWMALIESKPFTVHSADIDPPDVTDDGFPLQKLEYSFRRVYAQARNQAKYAVHDSRDSIFANNVVLSIISMGPYWTPRLCGPASPADQVFLNNPSGKPNPDVVKNAYQEELGDMEVYEMPQMTPLVAVLEGSMSELISGAVDKGKLSDVSSDKLESVVVFNEAKDISLTIEDTYRWGTDRAMCRLYQLMCWLHAISRGECDNHSLPPPYDDFSEAGPSK